LSDQKLLVEEWGGDIVALGVSAKTGEGVSKLLDMILLLADVEELKADVGGKAEGLIIESHKEQGRGAVANALVESGTLRPGQFIVAGASYARVRNLELAGGKAIKEADPSTPVVITGFKSLPEFGDPFVVVESEKEARNLAAANAEQAKTAGGVSDISGSQLIRMMDREQKLNSFNVIVKADVQGSLTSVIDSLKTMDTDEVAVRVVGSGVGVISENDVHLAHSSGAVIYGFNVELPTSTKRIASRDKVSIKLFSVIYELLDDAKAEMSKLLSAEIKETELGRLVVKAIFKTTKTDIICGGEVTKGKLSAPALVRVLRDKEEIGQAELINLKKGPQDAKEVIEGELCGMELKTASRLNLQEGDRLEVFRREEVARSL
jgi:translation initiation factor IF-2